MAKNKESVKETLDAITSKIDNKKYSDYDSIIIQLNNGDESIGNIKMMRQDIEIMSAIHGQSLGDITELMIETIVSESPKIKTNAEQRELDGNKE
jgi:hypothetical protein